MSLSDSEPLITKESQFTAFKPDLLSTWRRFLIGPVLFTYMSGYIMSYYIITEYTNTHEQKKFFREANLTQRSASEPTCNVSADSLEYETEKKATQSASNWIVYYSLAQGIPAVVSNMILGSYTDALGRKFLLGVGTLGTTARMCISVVVIRYELGLIYFIIACIIEGCTGQFATVLQASLAYVADITKPGEQRVYGIIYIEIMLGSSLTSASLVTGLLIHQFGYFVPVSVAAGLLVFSLLLVLVLLPESFPAERRHKDRSVLSMLQNSVSFFIYNDSQNNRWKYQVLAVGHFLCGISYLGRIATETLFQVSSPFCWTADTVGYYGAIRTGIQVTIGLGSIKLFRLCGMSDPIIAMIGVLSYGVNFAIEAFATNNLMLYIALAAGCWGPVEGAVARNIASSLTEPSRQGAIFAAIGGLEIACNLVSSVVLSSVYGATVSFMSGFVFLVVAATDLIGCLLFLFLQIRWKLEDRRSRKHYEIIKSC